MATGNDVSRERHWLCARRISIRRHELGLTQSDVVDRLTALGVPASNRTMSAIEHGQGVDVCRLPELAAALDCTVTYLLGLTAVPGNWAPDDAGHTAGSQTMGAAVGSRESWILGPDIPDLETRVDLEYDRA